MNAADAPHQVQPLHIIGGKVDHMTNRDLTNGHLTQSQHLDEDREVVNSAWPAVSQKSSLEPSLQPAFPASLIRSQRRLDTLTDVHGTPCHVWLVNIARSAW